jgi:myo-inositol 2-dehydrogenase/D-chiro-inositol 1-dehydrogenase
VLNLAYISSLFALLSIVDFFQTTIFSVTFFEPSIPFTMAPAIRRLRIAVAGLGRMGARHANHFLHRTPKAELVAAFTPAENEIAWAKENLEPWGVKIYTDYDEMLKHEGLEAVCVATVTTVHAEQTIKAIEAGKHVLCEKPLSTKLDVVCVLIYSS